MTYPFEPDRAYEIGSEKLHVNTTPEAIVLERNTTHLEALLLLNTYGLSVTFDDLARYFHESQDDSLDIETSIIADGEKISQLHLALEISRFIDERANGQLQNEVFEAHKIIASYPQYSDVLHHIFTALYEGQLPEDFYDVALYQKAQRHVLKEESMLILRRLRYAKVFVHCEKTLFEFYGHIGPIEFEELCADCTRAIIECVENRDDLQEKGDITTLPTSVMVYVLPLLVPLGETLNLHYKGVESTILRAYEIALNIEL